MNKVNVNLIPNIINPSPDYYCTWQTQLYATCDGKPEKQRAIVGERALFAKEKPYGWAYFYEKARRDLFFVIDDSWDIPVQNDGSYYGSLILNGERFPQAVSNSATNAEALKKLVERIKSLGWKGLGGWVCARESQKCDTQLSAEEYWKKRITDADKSGFSYWKVDWGEKAQSTEFRRMLTETAKKFAPNLIIEHSITFDILPYCDVFRTYDVPAVMSIPMTIKKLADIFENAASREMGIINCEDEVYIAAAGGFSAGIMRHPYSGAFTNGKADMSFPSLGRNLKTKMYEVIRAVRWHRVAPAFGGNAADISAKTLSDSWNFEKRDEEIETWWFDAAIFTDDVKENTVVKSAPSQIARNCGFAEVVPDKNGNIPYIVSSENPNGVFSVAALGRTLGRNYKIPKCDVKVNAQNAETIGVFGEYNTLCVETEHKNIKRVLMQDIAGDAAYDITSELEFYGNGFVVPGEIIHKIGTMSQPPEDTSEPGVAIKLCF